MVRYFYGEDTYAARQAIAAVAQETKSTIEWQDATEVAALPLSSWWHLQAGLFGATILVLRDPSLLPAATLEKILETATEQASGRPAILWDRRPLDNRSKLAKQLKQLGQQFSYPSEGELVSWLTAEAKQLGGTMQPAAARQLIGRLGPNRWRLRSEVEKLLLNNRNITAAAVAEIANEMAEANMFACLEAVARKQTKQALEHLDTLLAQGESEFYILSMLAYLFRTALNLRTALDQGVSVGELPSRLGISSFVIKKNLPFAQRLTREQLLEGLTRILATDFASKQGRVDSRTGLYMLVLTLSNW